MNAIAQVSAAPLTGPKLDNRRVLAGIVDLLIVTAGALVVLYAGDSLTGDRQGALVAVILGWALYYYFALESGAGQTVGKKLMKLRVVCADGRPAGMREIAVRTILRVVDGIGVYIVGLVVMLVTGERRQRVGDLAAGTIVVDASGPATAVAEPAAPDAEADADEVDGEDLADESGEDLEYESGEDLEHESGEDLEYESGEDLEAEAGEEPVAADEPTQTITLPSRPARPETLSDMTEPAAETAEEPAVEVEPAEPLDQSEPVPVPVAEPVAEAEPVAKTESVDAHGPSVEVEPFEVKPFEVEPYDMDRLESDEDEPAAEDALPSVASPSIQGLAADVAAAQDAGEGDEAAEESASADEAPESDEPVNVKPVETVSAMDLIMGAAEEDSAKPDEDEGPASA